MYFSAEEVKLIRAAAATMPIGGARDSGKAQLSSLCDYAATSTLEALIMDIDTRTRSQPPKIPRNAAEALCSLLSTICLSKQELRRLLDPEDPDLRDRALCHKRAMALRYVNKLRVPGIREGGPLSRQGARRGQRGR